MTKKGKIKKAVKKKSKTKAVNFKAISPVNSDEKETAKVVDSIFGEGFFKKMRDLSEKDPVWVKPEEVVSQNIMDTQAPDTEQALVTEEPIPLTKDMIKHSEEFINFQNATIILRNSSEFIDPSIHIMFDGNYIQIYLKDGDIYRGGYKMIEEGFDKEIKNVKKDHGK